MTTYEYCLIKPIGPGYAYPILSPCPRAKGMTSHRAGRHNATSCKCLLYDGRLAKHCIKQLTQGGHRAREKAGTVKSVWSRGILGLESTITSCITWQRAHSPRHPACARWGSPTKTQETLKKHCETDEFERESPRKTEHDRTHQTSPLD